MSCARLRPAHRMRQRSEFDRVFGRPRRLGNRFLTVLVRDNELDHPRLGLVVSKRVDKRAVVRNRLKRQIREAFRRRLEMLGGVDVVVMPKAGAAQLDRVAFNHQIEDLLGSIRPPSE